MVEILAQMGEKRLIRELQKYMGKGDKIVRSFSEDCAVIDSGGRSYRLYSVDSMVEGVHFRREYIPFFYLGRKALKVNLSDIASMGGTPEFYLVSLGAPADTPVQVILELYDGMHSIASENGMQLIGGNVTSAPNLFVDITIIGSVLKGKVLMRNGARKGDFLFVTGHLGSSAVGLSFLQEGFRLIGNGLVLPKEERDTHLVMEAIQSHMDPPCLVDLAKKLAQTSTLSSMIDLSDGLAGDLKEICNESDVGARVELAKVPIAPSVLYWERKRNRDPRILALQGGEDYHLLFTVREKFRDMFLRRIKQWNVQVYEIGQMVDRSQGIQAVDEEGVSHPLEDGYQHFR